MILTSCKPWLTFLGIALLLSGCGKNATANLSGKVTYQGQPLESGFISFYPEEGHGSSVGAAIVNGKYSVKGIALGKNRVHITINKVAKQADGNRGKNRADANAERLSKIKERKSKMPATASQDVEGAERLVEITASTSQYDIDLKQPTAQK